MDQDPLKINDEDLTLIEDLSNTNTSEILDADLEPLEESEVNYGSESYPTVLKQAVKNTPKSAANYVKSTYKALTHPINTASNLYTLAKGFLKTGVLRYMSDELGYDYDELNAATKDQDIAIAENIETHMLNTYGTEEGFKNALANDPVSVWSDVSSIVVPVAKGAGVSKLISKVEPISSAVKLASQPLKLVRESVPIHLYKKAVKFSSQLPLEKQNKLAKIATSAANQIMPTAKGMSKLRCKIDDLNGEITKLIDQSYKKGEIVSVGRLFKGIEKLKKEMRLNTIETRKVDKAFNNIKKDYRDMLKDGPLRTPQQVQKIKQDIYRNLKTYYEKIKATPAEKTMRIAVAKNAKEILEQIIPEIKQLNKNESSLIALQDAIYTKALNITNKDLVGMGLLVRSGTGSTMGYMIAGEAGIKAGTALGFLSGIVSAPKVKAKLALVIGKLREQGITVRPSAGAIALGLYELEKSKDIIE